MPKFKFQLFKGATSKVEKVMEISQPNMQEFSEEQMKKLNEMRDKIIKKTAELCKKDEKNSGIVTVLKQMISDYTDQKIQFSADKSEAETLLKADTISNSAVISDDTSEQIVDENSLLQQIQKIQLKPINKNEVQKEHKHAKTVKEKNGSPVFIVNPNDLTKITLKSANHNSVTSNPKNELTELEKILAKQRALLEEEIVNTESITREENLSVNEGANNNFSFYETKARALSMIIEEVESQRNSIFFTPVNEEPATDLDSDNDDIQKELRELEEFKEVEANIALEASLRQELEEAERQLEEVFQSLMDCDNKNAKPASNNKTPMSAYFKNSSSIDDSKPVIPVIVEEILKPKI